MWPPPTASTIFVGRMRLTSLYLFVIVSVVCLDLTISEGIFPIWTKFVSGRCFRYLFHDPIEFDFFGLRVFGQRSI